MVKTYRYAPVNGRFKGRKFEVTMGCFPSSFPSEVGKVGKKYENWEDVYQEVFSERTFMVSEVFPNSNNGPKSIRLNPNSGDSSLERIAKFFIRRQRHLIPGHEKDVNVLRKY